MKKSDKCLLFTWGCSVSGVSLSAYAIRCLQVCGAVDWVLYFVLYLGLEHGGAGDWVLPDIEAQIQPSHDDGSLILMIGIIKNTSVCIISGRKPMLSLI